MFFSQKSEDKLLLTVEVQSSVVRGSVVSFDQSGKCKVLFTESETVPYKQGVGISYFSKLTTRAVGSAIESCLKYTQGLKKEISEVHFILCSPWVVSQARTIGISYKEGTSITKERVEKILQDERKTISSPDNITLVQVEEKIFDVRLNGYSVSDWEDKDATTLEISYAITAGNKDFIEKLHDAASRVVSKNKVFFNSSLLLQYVSLREVIMPQESDYSVIHVHGELTDIVMIEHGLCTFFGSYPVGINTVVRKIAKLTDSDYKTADSLLSLHFGDKLEEAHAKSVDRITTSLQSGWNAEYARAIKNHDGNKVPPITYITARTHEDFFSEGYKTAHPESVLKHLSVDDVTVYALAIHRLQK